MCLFAMKPEEVLRVNNLLFKGITERLSSKGKNSFNINLDPLTESERLYDISMLINFLSIYKNFKLILNFENNEIDIEIEILILLWN